MQRAPVFVFDDALEAREFGEWIDQHEDEIRAVAEATTRSGKLTDIGQYQVGPLRYLRVNYTTGDAAGQNMTAQGDARRVQMDRGELPRRCRLRVDRQRSTPTRSTRRSTCWKPGASGWSPRP